MAVSANRKAQAGFICTRESTAPYSGIPNLLQKANIMQNNIPAQLIAAVAIPENHHQDLDAVSCRWQPLGFYTDRKAAHQACLTFIAALSDDLKEWAGFAVLTPENGSYARMADCLKFPN